MSPYALLERETLQHATSQRQASPRLSHLHSSLPSSAFQCVEHGASLSTSKLYARWFCALHQTVVIYMQDTMHKCLKLSYYKCILKHTLYLECKLHGMVGAGPATPVQRARVQRSGCTPHAAVLRQRRVLSAGQARTRMRNMQLLYKSINSRVP